jgi:hypothetical protein
LSASSPSRDDGEYSHGIGRSRLGSALAALKPFRCHDQLPPWGIDGQVVGVGVQSTEFFREIQAVLSDVGGALLGG